MAETGEKGKMKWKPVLAVVLVLAVLGLFFTSDFGKPFLGSMGEGLGGLTGYVFKPTQTGEGFELTLTTQKETFYMQKYNLVGSTLYVDGIYNFIKIGDQLFESKSGKSIILNIKGISGEIEFTSGGSIKLVGTSNYVEIADLIATSEKAMKVEIEIIPKKATISDFSQSQIKFANINGRLERYVGEAYDSITLSNSKLDIQTFAGSLDWNDDGVKLSGTALSAKGDNFSFD